MKTKHLLQFFFFILNLLYLQVAAQQDCALGSTAAPIHLETFGSGTNPGPALSPGITNYSYTTGWPSDGWYTISNVSNPDSGGDPFWYMNGDHTGNPNGYMMVVNAALAKGEFYRKRITGLCQKTTFVCSVWAANVNNPDLTDLCGSNCDFADILIKIENTSGAILNSISTGDLPIDSNGLVWKKYSLMFSPQAGQSTIDFVLVNNRPGGNGNDVVLDDITFKICLPNVTIATAPKVCAGQSVTINGALNPGFTDPEMQWQVSSGGGPWTDMPGDTMLNLVINNTVLPPPVLKYRLMVAERGNVQAPHCRVISNEIFVNIVPSLIATAPTVLPATCGNNSGSAGVNFTGGTPGYTYLWSPGGGTSQNITGLASGTYTAIVTDTNGCADTTVAVITQENGPILTASANTHVSCHGGNDGLAQATATGGTGVLSYLWSPTGQTTNTITGLYSGTYTVVVTDVNGCTDIQTVTISQPISAVSLHTSVSGFSCAGASPNGVATATAGGGTPPFSYLWNPGNKTTPVISNLIAGTYSVTITDSKGCSDTKTATILPSTKPDAKFSSEPFISCEGVMVKFTDESTPSTISSWSWSFGDGTTSYMQHPTHNFSYNAGTYNVTLVVENSPCKDTVKSTIHITDMFSYASFEAANIFTPNNDGKNDCFTPALIGKDANVLIECVSLEVFDRWGIKMFESDGTVKCWNGNNRNDSMPAVDGVYYYVSTLGKTTIKGYVTLARNKPR